VPARRVTGAERRDRPLPAFVHVRDPTPLRTVDEGRVHLYAPPLELLLRAPADLLGSERGEEEHAVREQRELHGCDCAAAARLLPRRLRMNDLAGMRHVLDLDELDPLDVADDSRSHARHAHRSVASRVGTEMMMAVVVPPFERFYEEHRSEVLRLLRRKLGSTRADDAFQETFLRALQAYGRLESGEHLRAWVLTIARNVAIDVLRRTRPTQEIVETPFEDERPAYEQLAPLTNGLPPKERRAVVLRYGYDLSYDQIAAALGSSEDAARQAASTGVRRLRRRISP